MTDFRDNMAIDWDVPIEMDIACCPGNLLPSERVDSMPPAWKDGLGHVRNVTFATLRGDLV